MICLPHVAFIKPLGNFVVLRFLLVEINTNFDFISTKNPDEFQIFLQKEIQSISI